MIAIVKCEMSLGLNGKLENTQASGGTVGVSQGYDKRL